MKSRPDFFREREECLHRFQSSEGYKKWKPARDKMMAAYNALTKYGGTDAATSDFQEAMFRYFRIIEQRIAEEEKRLTEEKK